MLNRITVSKWYTFASLVQGISSPVGVTVEIWSTTWYDLRFSRSGDSESSSMISSLITKKRLYTVYYSQGLK